MQTPSAAWPMREAETGRRDCARLPETHDLCGKHNPVVLRDQTLRNTLTSVRCSFVKDKPLSYSVAPQHVSNVPVQSKRHKPTPTNTAKSSFTGCKRSPVCPSSPVNEAIAIVHRNKAFDGYGRRSASFYFLPSEAAKTPYVVQLLKCHPLTPGP